MLTQKLTVTETQFFYRFYSQHVHLTLHATFHSTFTTQCMRNRQTHKVGVAQCRKVSTVEIAKNTECKILKEVNKISPTPKRTTSSSFSVCSIKKNTFYQSHVGLIPQTLHIASSLVNYTWVWHHNYLFIGTPYIKTLPRLKI